MSKNVTVITLFLLIVSANIAVADGFLTVSGTSIVDGNRNPIILRGMGLGGWMLPEGYMLQTSAFANAPWEIEKKISDLVGAQNAESFWTAYRKNFVQRKDIERIAQLGFNSIRLPMHYKLYMKPTATGYDWLEEGFVTTDSLLRWCADNNIYLILDLHGAPGGQSANNISDYNPAFLSLWESEKNKTMTVDLWKRLAGRYKDEPWIGGYDILNEPAWDLPPSNKPLRDLSVAITAAIRSVDTSHIIFVEGNWFATDFNGMTPAWDAKMVWSFHKYWNTNDIGAINYLLTLRANTNRPLWLGESGENSNAWFTDCISLMEANKIGWAWWTLKKFSTINGPFNIPVNAEYDYLLRYWKGQATKPTVEFAMKGLMGMAEGLKLENCIYNEGVIDAMLRQPSDPATRPFSANTVPGKVFAVDYDYGRHTVAYKDNDYHNTNNGSTWNNGWIYRNDGVDIERCSDAVTNGYNVGWTGTGEFLVYTVNVLQSGKYSITLRTAVNNTGGYVGVGWDGGTQVLTPLPVTGGWTSWGNASLGTVELTAGTHKFKLATFFGGFNLNYLLFTYAGPLIVNEENTRSTEFSLGQNYPNPFNPSTTIAFSVKNSPSAAGETSEMKGKVRASLKVFNLLGQHVQTLFDEFAEPGRLYTIPFVASQLPSGIYYYTLQAGTNISTKKMLLMK
jgi:hypothetical protein